MKIDKNYSEKDYDNKYPEYIMEDLRQRRGLEIDDESEDDEIISMNKEDVLDEVASWNGMIGYGNTIKEWVQDIYNVDLDTIE